MRNGFIALSALLICAAATDAAIQQYQGIVARGGWNAVPAGGELKVGVKSRAVQALRQRLIASGDLDPVAGTGAVFDSYVEAAVKRFQARHGLAATGMMTPRTLAALNVPVKKRIQQLEASLGRLVEEHKGPG